MSNTTISLIVRIVLLIGLPLAKLIFKTISPQVWDVVEAFLRSIQGATDPVLQIEMAASHMRTCEGVACRLETKRIP